MGKIQVPPGWKVMKLEEVCLKKTLTNPQKKPNKSFTYVDVSSISNDLYQITDTKEILGKNAPSRARQIIYKNDVVFATVRPTLKRVALIPLELDEQICSTGFCVLRSNPEYLDSTYLYFYLLTNRINQRVEALQKGVTYPAINDSDLFGQEIFIPSLTEQKTIAHTLQTIQKAKETHQRELELERERKAALMQYLFTHGTCNEPREQKEIGEFPKSWDVLPLGEIITLQRGKDLPASQRTVGEVPIIGSNGVVGYHNQAVENIPVPGLATGRSGSIGFLTYIDRLYHPLNTVLYVKDFKGNNPLFLYYWLHLFGFKKYSSGVSVPTLNRNMVHPILFILPKYPEQIKIAHILKTCDRKIQALEKEIALTDELFHAMLEQLMIGKISTQPLTETYV